MSRGRSKYLTLTTAQALVRHLAAQRIEIDGREESLFGGVFAIFGHGNVSCLGEALYAARDTLPTWRGQNEQSMALAALGYAKFYRRRRLCAATSSIGPGATNMVTAAAAAHANRLPLLLLSGDVFNHRLPHPVLQQIENFADPTISVNDAFKCVTRYWDRISHPAQIIQSLPAAIATMLDPADSGPAFLALPQDTQGYAYDFPQAFFTPRVHHIRRPPPEREEVMAAVRRLRGASRPVIIAGGGVHYSLAEQVLARFAERHSIPVVETIAGMATLLDDHPLNLGRVGVTGISPANVVCGEADLVLAVGTRLQDFTTGSWTVFGEDAALIGLNAARFDAYKHLALPLICDAREGLTALDDALGDWRADQAWTARAANVREQWNDGRDKIGDVHKSLPSYADVVRATNRLCSANDRIVSAAGGLPGEIAAHWRSKSVASVDLEYGYSCMGYEIAGAWGARIAQMEAGAGGDTIVLVGDGSYLMLNSEIYSSVLSGKKLIVIICDNGGFAVIDRLQRSTGNASFNNLIADCHYGNAGFAVDFASHARAMGARSEAVSDLASFATAFERAKESDRTAIIEIKIDPHAWTEAGQAWWEVGTPEVSQRPEVLAATADMESGRQRQRRGV
ncbi:MAG TPA: 3D-(3,5/4)-trihydroxycyclohexane-1,2-dione acylhydrolase (decyclizing) [Rhizomicrobium sp.]|nr:3D-(3,5/4)-trihydroxycyclohexane-1,2-dione acylhydrolase (decyclizing) [Rhizomicrobium sp.]